MENTQPTMPEEPQQLAPAARPSILQKNLYFIIFLAVTLLITAGLLWYSGTVTKVKTDTGSTTVVDELKGWETYVNTEQGYSISYPETYHLASYSGNNKSLVNYNENDLRYEKGALEGVKIQIQHISVPDVVLVEAKQRQDFIAYQNSIIQKNRDAAADSFVDSLETDIVPISLGNVKYSNRITHGPGGVSNVYYAFALDGKSYYKMFVWGEENDSQNTQKIISSFNPITISWNTQQIRHRDGVINVQDIPAMRVSSDAVFGEQIGESGEFKDVKFSPDNTKVAFVVSDPAHDFGWVYDFSTEEFIPLSFQYGGGVDIIEWKNEHEVVLELSSPKPAIFQETFDLNNLSEYPKVGDISALYENNEGGAYKVGVPNDEGEDDFVVETQNIPSTEIMGSFTEFRITWSRGVPLSDTRITLMQKEETAETYIPVKVIVPNILETDSASRNYARFNGVGLPAGTYTIKVEQKSTGKYDMSDARLTLVPESIAKLTLTINGKKVGPFENYEVESDSQVVELSWTSERTDSCLFDFYYRDGRPRQAKYSSGSTTVHMEVSKLNMHKVQELRCTIPGMNGFVGTDFVFRLKK